MNCVLYDSVRLAPTQLRLLPVVDEVRPYCERIAALASQLGLRVEVDKSGNRLAKLIRSSEQEKVPITAVVGIRERDSNALSLRARKVGELAGGRALDASVVLDLLKKAAANTAAEEDSGLEAFVRSVNLAAESAADVQ